ncbi:Glycosyltransferase involved in cell wall bisynthesis [Algoriella xinjiangensis]|uniref:Glycosyltransferase involved in cell wall bisynthesis n=1 Tax=Algoriella xinjiangensis TaxID=684065 RepID=A0A1I4VGT7_9FLAO|nr:glycosyltransferase [Algoriella xinjiangensis]SFN00377.1 Glycosyltransferase involved in cell wall bisynthesis [Algoriella xinjiangensis]
MSNQPEKIKVLFRLRSLEMGGVPRVVLDLLRNLPKDKFDFTLMLNLYQGELINDIPNDVKLIVVEKGKEQMSSNPIINKIQLAFRRLKLEIYDKFPSVLYALKVPQKFDIEVSPGYAEFDMVLNSPDKKSRKIGWFHTDVSYDKDEKRVLSRIEKMKHFDFMIFGSKQTRQVIDDLYQVQYSKSTVIYNVIKVDEVLKKADLVDYSFQTDLPVFSSMGRLHHRKGYHTLMKVHKRLLDDGFQHKIAVIGGGNEMENLQNQRKELNVEDSFLLLDSQTNPYPYIKASDYFILPTQSESYPLVIGEVMCMRKPIISTNVGGISEMIDDGVDGILIKYDEQEMYDAMKQFMTNPDFVTKLIQGAETAYNKFDEKEIYRQVSEVFEQQYQLKLSHARN